jgi:hypothetical protein
MTVKSSILPRPSPSLFVLATTFGSPPRRLSIGALRGMSPPRGAHDHRRNLKSSTHKALGSRHRPLTKQFSPPPPPGTLTPRGAKVRRLQGQGHPMARRATFPKAKMRFALIPLGRVCCHWLSGGGGGCTKVLCNRPAVNKTRVFGSSVPVHFVVVREICGRSGHGSLGVERRTRSCFFFCWLKLFFLNFCLFVQWFFVCVGLLDS